MQEAVQRMRLATTLNRKKLKINFKIAWQVVALLIQEANSCRTRLVIKLYLRLFS